MDCHAENLIAKGRKQIRLITAQASMVGKMARTLDAVATRNNLHARSSDIVFFVHQARQLADNLNRLTALMNVHDKEVLMKLEKLLVEVKNHYDV